MREIKFRAWDGNAFHYNVVPLFCNDLCIIECHPLAGLRLKPVKNIQEYTGLHDKNGKEMYEGDIVQCLVKTIEQKEEEIQQYSVQYESGLAAWLLFPLGLCSKGEFLYSTGADILEVIGNIYEAKKEKK